MMKKLMMEAASTAPLSDLKILLLMMILNAASCHYEFGWVCDVCISDDYMPTPNGDGCIPKLPNCDVTPYEQP